jgi:glycosyltransferase involved in cell wall biosynthesis
VLTLWLAQAFRARGHEAAVFAAKRSVPFTDLRPGKMEDYAVEGVPVRRIGRPEESLSRPYQLNYDNPRMADGMGEAIRWFRPDVVHFMHLQGLSASVIAVVKEQFGLPALYTATDFWSMCPVVDLRRHDGVLCEGPDPAHCPRCLASRQPDSGLARALRAVPGPVLQAADAVSRAPLPLKPLPLRQLRDLSGRMAYVREKINTLDRVLAPTRLTRDLLVANGVDPGLVEVSRYGVVTPNALSRTAPPEGARPFRFGFIGTLAPHKGCDLLIEAFRGLPAGSDATLTIHGASEGFDGFFGRLERLAGGDPRIRFAGSFPPAEMRGVLSKLDALVVPSRWYENAPLVVYSALAVGVPVVATDLGGLSEVVEHEKNGLLFPLEDSGALSRCLERLVVEKGLVGRLKAGTGPVRGIEESVDELERLYDALTRPRAEAP